MLRRHQGHTQVTPEEVMARPSSRPTREAFAKARGAAQSEIDAVVNFARDAGLQIVDADVARRAENPLCALEV
jgi:hypothetical protein